MASHSPVSNDRFEIGQNDNLGIGSKDARTLSADQAEEALAALDVYGDRVRDRTALALRENNLMARVRRVLSLLCIEEAQRKRICYHDRRRHSIEKGATCLVIREASGEGRTNCCLPCGLEILDQAADDLDRLRRRTSIVLAHVACLLRIGYAIFPPWYGMKILPPEEHWQANSRGCRLRCRSHRQYR